MLLSAPTSAGLAPLSITELPTSYPSKAGSSSIYGAASILDCANSVRSSPNGTWRSVREAGDCCHHHAGKQLHGSDVLMIEGIGCGGEHFEDSQRILKLA